MRSPQLHEGDAFGLRISSGVAVAGLRPLAQRPSRQVTLEAASERGALRRLSGTEVLYRGGDGEPPQLLIDRRPDGYGVWSPQSGRYLISEDGRHIQAVPARRLWPWPLLFAQTLPIAAALQGLEVLHASAVDIRGGVCALVGPSGAGKSTLAAALVRRGAEFVADDVVALEVIDREVLAHPGVGIVNASTEVRRQGVAHDGVVARTAAKHHLAVQRVQEARPLRTLVFLSRVAADAPARIERVPAPNPFWLLGSTFVFVVQEPKRLVAQLDLHQLVASQVCVLHARLPWLDDVDGVANALEAQLP